MPPEAQTPAEATPTEATPTPAPTPAPSVEEIVEGRAPSPDPDATGNGNAETPAEATPAEDVPPPTPEPPPPAEPDPFAGRFAALTRKERQVRERVSGLKQREEELKTREERAGRIDNDIFGYLDQKHPGWYDGYTRRLLGKEQSETEKIEALRAEVAEEKKQRLASETKSQEKSDQQRWDDFVDKSVDFVQAHPEKYELTIAHGQESQVAEVIKHQFNADGTWLSTEEAAELVEQHFEKEQLEKFAGTKKFQARFQPVKTEPVAPTPPAQPEVPSGPTSLSNNMNSVPPPRSLDEMSDDEAFAEILRRAGS